MDAVEPVHHRKRASSGTRESQNDDKQENKEVSHFQRGLKQHADDERHLALKADGLSELEEECHDHIGCDLPWNQDNRRSGQRHMGQAMCARAYLSQELSFLSASQEELDVVVELRVALIPLVVPLVVSNRFEIKSFERGVRYRYLPHKDDADCASDKIDETPQINTGQHSCWAVSVDLLYDNPDLVREHRREQAHAQKPNEDVQPIAGQDVGGDSSHEPSDVG